MTVAPTSVGTVGGLQSAAWQCPLGAQASACRGNAQCCEAKGQWPPGTARGPRARGNGWGFPSLSAPAARGPRLSFTALGNAPRQQAEACPPRRSAFTLIEILVVITIFMILMGLTIGSVVRGPKLQRMVAAEQVIADCIRQARHMAQTSGQPVVLRLRRNERSIGGLLRQPLWHGIEEQWPPIAGTSSPVFAPGRSGTGLMVPECYATSADVLLVLSTLTGGNRLWRGQASPANRPGLLLSVAVRPPMAGETGVPQVIPLVLVGEDLTAGFASFDDSSCGLALLQSDAASDVRATGRHAVAKSWEILGWFGKEGAGRVEVSSLLDVPPDLGALTDNRTNLTIVRKSLTDPSLDVVGDAEAGPLVGGRWTELALLAEGPRLVLYRDGRRVGEKAGIGATDLPVHAAERVYVGFARVVASERFATGAQIDDVRLERLGDALAGTLPSGVKADADRRITCHPDGRVEVDASGAAATGNTAINLSSDSGESAVIDITTAGAVSSRTVVPTNP